MKTGVVVVAAGRGSRLGDGIPKQYRELGGKTVLERTLSCFLSSPDIEAIQVVIHQDDIDLYKKAVETLQDADSRLKSPVSGGATRQESVLAGLVALGEADYVLVHDAARPFLSPALLTRTLEAVKHNSAAIPGIPVTNTIKQVDDHGLVTATPPRASLRAVQTPQAFHYPLLLQAHRKAASEAISDFSDDGALMEWAGYEVMIFDGETANIKLTYEDDFAMAENTLTGAGQVLVSRTGIGFDVHAMGEGDHIWLGGIRIPHRMGVLAHSDGDVVLHALTDAVLGALADGDIGFHFPPSDPKWKGAASDQFLAFACEKVRQRNGIIDHMDVVLMCEEPRLTPHREAMRQRVAEIAALPLGKVSVKATTTEKLGFVGRQEGVAAQAAVSIRLPEIN